MKKIIITYAEDSSKEVVLETIECESTTLELSHPAGQKLMLVNTNDGRVFEFQHIDQASLYEFDELLKRIIDAIL